MIKIFSRLLGRKAPVESEPVMAPSQQSVYGSMFDTLQQANRERCIYRDALEKIGSGLGDPQCARSTMSQIAREALERGQASPEVK